MLGREGKGCLYTVQEHTACQKQAPKFVRLNFLYICIILQLQPWAYLGSLTKLRVELTDDNPDEKSWHLKQVC